MLVSDHAENYAGNARREAMHVAIGMLGGVLVLNSALAEWFFPTIIEPVARDFSAILGVLLLGAPIAAAAVRDLLRGTTHMSELAALAIAAAVAGGDYRTAGGVAFLLFITGVFERRTAVGAEAAIEAVVKLTPRRARRLRGGIEEEIDALELRVGDVCRVRPGENLPADGRVSVGAGSVNEASVTGESLPVDKSIGDEVFAGTQNLTGALDIEVTRVGSDTTIGKVRDLIAQAQASRLPVMRTVDHYASYYTPTVLMIAAMAWFLTRDLNRVISVLVVSCPCALILAAPSALVAAVAAAARLGILIKDVSHLELIARIRSVVFDKTGTLTEGTLEVARLQPADGVELADLLLAAATAECRSNHPVAKGLRRLAEEAGVAWPEPSAYSEVPGQGVETTIGNDILRAGRESWLRTCGIHTQELHEALDPNQVGGMSLVFVARNERFLGWVGLRDAIRPETAPAIAELGELGIGECWMVTGDNEHVARRVGAEIGIEETRIRAACLPDEKVAVVQKIRGTGKTVAVVGDGVNDGPALAAGDIGVAMGAAGSDVAMHSASVALMNNDLRRIPFLVALARRTHRIMVWNMGIGLAFIVGGLALSAGGRIAPLAAALLHSAGTLIVVFNSARLVRAGEEPANGSQTL